MKDKSSRVAPALGTAVTVRYEQFRLGRTPRCPGGGGRPKETPPMENNSSDSQNLAPLALAGMTRFQRDTLLPAEILEEPFCQVSTGSCQNRTETV